MRTRAHRVIPGAGLVVAAVTACWTQSAHKDDTVATSTSTSTDDTSTSASPSSSSTTTPTSTSPESSSGTTLIGSTSGPTSSSTEPPEPCSEVHEGDLYIFNSTDFASVANLGRVTGHLHVFMGQREQVDLSFLKCLHTIEKGLYITENANLESTAGVENLQKLGALSITQNPSLRVVSGFDKIFELSLLEISRNPELEGIQLDSLQTANHIQIGYCEYEMAAALHPKLVDLAGFSGLTKVTRIGIDGNEALASAAVLDALAANGEAVPLEHAMIRFNPLLSESEIHAKLDVLGVQDRDVCGNAEGALGCYCLVGD